MVINIWKLCCLSIFNLSGKLIVALQISILNSLSNLQCPPFFIINVFAPLCSRSLQSWAIARGIRESCVFVRLSIYWSISCLTVCSWIRIHISPRLWYVPCIGNCFISYHYWMLYKMPVIHHFIFIWILISDHFILML